MGTSLTTPATIVVKIDKDQQYTAVDAGTMLKGTVYLDVRSTSLECSTLQLIITGAERTCVHYTTHSGSG